MNKNKAKKVTLQDLIARAEQRKLDKKELRQLYIKSLDATITIMKPDRSLVLDSMNMEDESDGDRHLIYNCVVEPSLKDSELHKAYKVVSPMDIVDEVFDPGEVANISKEIVRMAGYIDSVEVVKNIKN
ncbi:hypothetical protein CIW83_16880 [Tissierella sp. P1]|uniref:phage tail assembly chaperone n=1 Tax=Tissierella sp. P1 TaxID=1280483 RepID=UPI000BA10EE8|nr:hypothetical protein [Tissierella sp. P1]OZV11058.1 hypothetical protein CIW83_16880 [Tissierella sp. P1]